jgi:uncharacterized membrane protein
MLGVGLVGSLDEIVLHQLLQWHNFYVHADEYWRIVSDGLFHTLTTALLFAGALRLWDQRALMSRAGQERALAAGVLLGMGGFNLFDGIVIHKILQLHPVREGVDNLLAYDFVYNGLAVMLLGVGWLLWRDLRSDPAETATERELTGNRD